MLSGNTYSPATSVADSATTSDNNLRSAIAAANADTGTATDTIQLTSGTYTLSLGQLEISNTAHTLIIEGQGSTGSAQRSSTRPPSTESFKSRAAPR